MLGNQLKELRKFVGLKQEEVAKKLNMSSKGYSHYETGLREPNIETIKKLCIIFNCSADELLEMDEAKRRIKLQ